MRHRRRTKGAELARDPACALRFIAPVENTQIRIRAEAAVHAGDALARSAWPDVPQAGWSDYAGRPAPGTPLPEPGVFERDPGGDGERAQAHFAVGRLKLRTADGLEFGGPEHRRAHIDFLARPPLVVWTAP